MIFKQLKDGTSKVFHLDNQDKIANEFSFEVVDKLLYKDHDNIFLDRIEKEIDRGIFPDLIAALLQNFYKRGFVRAVAFRNALASTALILTSDKFKCEFLGLIKKGEEENNPNVGVEFHKSFKYTPLPDIASWKYEYTDRVNSLLDIINKDDIKQSFNIFFVAGCQSIEMLDSRVRKAAITISELTKEDILNDKNIKVILSGWNNAKEGKYQKVRFSNESAIMTNLLLHKLEHYLKPSIKIFSYKSVIPEMESADTTQNIKGLLKIVTEIKTQPEYSNYKFNFFIVSSTFHLLQIQPQIHNQIKNDQSELNKLIADKNYDFFYIGSENPLHFFKTSDDGYMKLLFHWTILRNFKFLANKRKQ